MKKLFCAVVAMAMVATFASCNKTCTCKQYKDGKEVSKQTYTIDKDSDKKCSDYATTAIVETSNGKTGWECK